MNLLDSLTESVVSHPSQLALDVEGNRITYAELDTATRRVVTALRWEGISGGDRVAYLGRSALEYYVLIIGCMRAGAVPVPLNWRCTLAELATVLVDSRPAMLVIDVEFGDQAEALVAATGSRPSVVTRGAAPTEMGSCVPGAVEWSKWLDVKPAREVAAPAPDDTVLQMYTSGTTGRPKGVMSSESSLNAYLHVMADATALDRDAVSLSGLPHFHIGGTCWTLAGLLRGSTVIVTRDSKPASWLRIVQERGVTVLVAVPTLIKSLAEESERAGSDNHSVETIYYGGSAISETVLKFAVAQLRCDFVQGYGLTECSLIAVMDRRDHTRSELHGSCGKPVRGCHVRVVDPTTQVDVKTGQVGEIWVQSPLQMKGYWNPPEAAAEGSADGWLRTGDMAYQDAEGFLFLRDRLKDVIITGGENVFSAEVENVLMAHPLIDDCAVIGLPSKKWTETVVAIVVSRHDGLTESGVLDHCRGLLARYKCPTCVIFSPSLPRNPTGKILKGALRSEYADTPVE